MNGKPVPEGGEVALSHGDRIVRCFVLINSQIVFTRIVLSL